MTKPNCDSICLLAGLGVEGDAHLGTTVKHRSRVARDPSQPNLRQVHLIHSELFGELRADGDRARADAEFAAGLGAFAARLTLGADEPFTRYYAAAIHALCGENDEALALLESAAAELPAFVRARARIEPEWESLRGDRRFGRLIGEREES